MLTLTEDLRCLGVSEQSPSQIHEPNSPMTFIPIIREQIKANKTDAEIIDFLVDRYGDFVLTIHR